MKKMVKKIEEIKIKYSQIPKLKKKGKKFMISNTDANRIGKVFSNAKYDSSELKLYEEANNIIMRNDWNKEKQLEWEEKLKSLNLNELEKKLKAVFDSISDIIIFTQMSPEEIADILSFDEDEIPEKSTQRELRRFEMYNKWCLDDSNPLSDSFFP